MSHLKLKPSECSPLGKLLLEYVEQHPDINLSKLAKEMGLSRPGLGWICLKHTSPNEETAAKIAAVLGLEEWEVARLVHWNKLDNFANPDFLEKVSDIIEYINRLEFNKRRLAPGAFLVDEVANDMHELFETLRRSEHHLYPESRRCSDFQIYKRALDMIKARLLMPDRASKKVAKNSTSSEADERVASVI